MSLYKFDFPKGGKVIEGKTKALYEVLDYPGLLIAEYKSDITAFDDPRFTTVFGTKARDSNAVTCRIFELLQQAGLPVAYLGKLSETEFVAPRVQMAPVELITRRFVHPKGSIRKRRPELPPHYRFGELTFEVCLKTHNGGKYTNIFGAEVDLALPRVDDKPTDDPMVLNPLADEWKLIGKSPLYDPEVIATVKRDEVLHGVDEITEYRRLLHAAFLIIEAFFKLIGWTTYDLKVECGRLKEDFQPEVGPLLKAGTIVIADVIDHDSWRVLDESGREMSKQVFRDMILAGKLDQDEIAQIYSSVVRAVENFRVQEQALVLWRGSEDDNFPDLQLNGSMGRLDLNNLPGIKVERITGSGHKQTIACLDRLNALQARYKYGAIIVEVGRSNGLGPTLAAHTIWPVISRPASLEKCPGDIWSNLRCPSNDPMATIIDKGNAVLFALRQLAPLNPYVAAWLQYGVEQLEATPV
ncbi:MAG: phosphoribosylaminoimidazolesuccinocarboxamide synthase [Patescibacteria group bacterium]|jgi:phosphoribosylaminoimidazole carboxylase/phosphoribosylaminoimidazole-succinocarboxamide synthase